MSKINILSEHLSNKIAAGEVIERPASVVKELVENAIDSGATRIVIEIERAGTRLISVADNGSGMDSDDALLCLEPHGTSKINDDEDINNILTLGFRGEAIPSIAAISRFTLQTRTANMVEGTMVQVDGGKIRESLPTGCAPGTTVQVRDLFFNTPARKKFLKTDATEEHHIEETVIALALPNPEISFELIINGSMSIISPGAKTLQSRLRAFFGRNFADQMLEVHHIENDMVITGYVAAPGFTRSVRREQRTFVNGRAIDSLALYRGIKNGYSTLSDHGRYPPCVLFIEMEPSEVDVNVHPAKREVRFKREYVVSRAVETAVSRALQKRKVPDGTIEHTVPVDSFMDSAKISYTPSQVKHPEFLDWEEEGVNKEKIQRVDFLTDEPYQPKRDPATDILEEEDLDVADKCEEQQNIEEQIVEEPTIRPMPEKVVFSGDWPNEVIGILDKTFILASGNNGLVLIDQHAAHERVLFEQLLRDSEDGVASQPLLLPIMIDLPQTATSMMSRSRDIFLKLGFDIEPMGSNSVMLNAVPSAFPTNDLETMLLDTLSELIENSTAKIPIEDEFVARAACKAAIKANDELTLKVASQLLRELGKCRQGTLCPHGRPTMLTITISEISRRFGRK